MTFLRFVRFVGQYDAQLDSYAKACESRRDRDPPFDVFHTLGQLIELRVAARKGGVKSGDVGLP